MKYNVRFLLVATASISILAMAAQAQVQVTGQESADKSASRGAVAVTTMDRTVVPAIIETKKTEIDPNTTRLESVTQVRLNDGTYAQSQRATTVERKLSGGVTETATEIVERDRQGGTHATRQVNQTLVKTPEGSQRKTTEYTRDASGKLVLADVTTEVTKKNPDGTVSVERVEQTADINGKLVPKQQVAETITERGPNEKAISRDIKSVDHMTGQFAVTAKETSVVRTEGGTTRTETVVQQPGRTGWEVFGKTTTTETRAADGTVQRETVEQERSLFTKHTGDGFEPLVDRKKVVEREVRKPDGTTVMQRDVLYRDVNGGWKPASFAVGLPQETEEKPGNSR
jgi:hypothetical protein